jgi:aspartate-semialdehyde dehydrogenase
MTNKTFKVAVVGATGAVGETMLSILEERNFPIGELVALASERSAGSKVNSAIARSSCRTWPRSIRRAPTSHSSPRAVRRRRNTRRSSLPQVRW